MDSLSEARPRNCQQWKDTGNVRWKKKNSPQTFEAMAVYSFWLPQRRLSASDFQQTIHGGIYWCSSTIVLSKYFPEQLMQQVSRPENSNSSWRIDDWRLSTNFLGMISLASYSGTTIRHFLSGFAFPNVKFVDWNLLWVWGKEQTKRSTLQVSTCNLAVF